MTTTTTTTTTTSTTCFIEISPQKRKTVFPYHWLANTDFRESLQSLKLAPWNIRVFSADFLKASEIGSSYYMTNSDRITSNVSFSFFAELKTCQPGKKKKFSIQYILLNNGIWCDKNTCDKMEHVFLKRRKSGWSEKWIGNFSCDCVDQINGRLRSIRPKSRDCNRKITLIYLQDPL